ncbi:TonB-dependent receptor [candidate division KSB1 bacterium]
MRFIRTLVIMVAVAAASHFFAVAVSAQTLSGKVTDESNSPISHVNVYIRTLQGGAATDEEGEYIIRNLPRGIFNVEISSIGYKKEERRVNLTNGDVTLDVILTEEAIETEELTVTARKTISDQLRAASQSRAVIDIDELEKKRGQTLGEAIEGVTGVTVLRTGPSIAKPIIRGLHSQRVLLLNHGIQQEGQQWGGEHAPEIDPFMPERIEVLKGAAGVQYGSNAIGGVISVEPRELRERPGIGGKLSLNAFSNNRQGSGSLFVEGGSKRFPGFGWRLQGSMRRAGDSRTPDYYITNSGFKERNGSLAIGYNGYTSGYELYISQFETELGIFTGSHIGNLSDLQRAFEHGRPLNTGDFTYEVKPPKQDVIHRIISLKTRHIKPTLGKLELQIGRQTNRRKEFDAHKPYSDELSALNLPSIELKLTTYTADATFTLNPIRSSFGKIGVSGMKQENVQKGTVFLIPNYRMYSGGIYAVESIFLDDWIFELGARFDYKRIKVYRDIAGTVVSSLHNYNNVSGVFGFIYQFSDHWSIGSNLGSAWRAPSLNELYSKGVHHGAAQYETGDLDLITEKSYNVDVTLRHISDKIHLELSAYNNFMRDFIYLFPEPEPVLTIRGAFPAFSYRQHDAVLRGFEGSVEYKMTDRFSIGATTSMVRGQNRITDEPLFQMPADRVKVLAEYLLPSTTFFTNQSFEFSVNAVRKQGRSPAGADFVPPPNGYMLFDVNYFTDLSLMSRKISFSLSIQNLFDTSRRDYLSRYRYFAEDPGRNIVLRFQTPFGIIDN